MNPDYCGMIMTSGQEDLAEYAKVVSEKLTIAQWLKVVEGAIECHKKGVKDFDVFIAGHLDEISRWESKNGRKIWPEAALTGEQTKEAVAIQSKIFGQTCEGRNPPKNGTDGMLVIRSTPGKVSINWTNYQPTPDPNSAPPYGLAAPSA